MTAESIRGKKRSALSRLLNWRRSVGSVSGAFTMPTERTGKERSVADLCHIDERNVFVQVDDQGRIWKIGSEDIQADFLRAESALGPNVPVKLRERIAVARNLATYGCFSYEFYAVSVFWSLSCVEMALRAKFVEMLPAQLSLMKKGVLVETAPLSYEVEEKVRRRKAEIDGFPGFDFSLFALLNWAEETNLLPSEADSRAIRDLRNNMAHPKFFNWVLPPDAAFNMFEVLIKVVVELWPE
jgi:hypothetical protein